MLSWQSKLQIICKRARVLWVSYNISGARGKLRKTAKSCGVERRNPDIAAIVTLRHCTLFCHQQVSQTGNRVENFARLLLVMLKQHLSNKQIELAAKLLDNSVWSNTRKINRIKAIVKITCYKSAPNLSRGHPQYTDCHLVSLGCAPSHETPHHCTMLSGRTRTKSK